MRNRGLAVGALTLSMLWAALPQSVGAASPSATAHTSSPDSVTMTDQVLVRWATVGPLSLTTQRSRTAALSEASNSPLAYVRRTAAGSDVYRLAAPLGTGADQTLAALRATPGVASVEPDLWLTAQVQPPTNDTYAASLWGLLGPANGSPYGINAVGAWPTTTGAGVTVAVIDTGLLKDHPDLNGPGLNDHQWVKGYDLIGADGPGVYTTANDTNGRDDDASDPGDWCYSNSASSWHGTHVAGTIAARPNNNTGVFGGAPGVKIEPVRVLGRCGGYDSDVADGIRWAAGDATVPQVPGSTSAYLPVNPQAATVRVLNLSLGGGGTCTAGSDMAQAIAYARSQGKVVVVAAGNSGTDVGTFMPANCPGAFTVAAITESGRRASFSNYGTAAHPFVDIAAPGENVLSTLNAGFHNPATTYDDTICQTGSATAKCAYAYYKGTSMATPHVALTAALVASVNPALTPDQIQAILKSTAHPFAQDSSKKGCTHNYPLHCGAGIVNAADAVTAALATVSTGGPAVSPPTVAIGGPQSLSGNVTLHVSWPAATDDDGVAQYQLQRSVNGGAWNDVTLGSPTDLAVDIALAPGSSHDLRLRAQDGVGNWSAWMDEAGGPTTLALYQENQKPPLAYSGKFKRVSLSGATGGYVKRSGAAGRFVTFSFTGTSAAWVSALGPNRGIASVSLDGAPVAAIDLFSSSLQAAQIVWAPTASLSPGAHTITVTVTGTHNSSSSGNRVDIDAFLSY